MKQCLWQQLQQQFEKLRCQQQLSFSIQRSWTIKCRHSNICSFHGPDTVDHFHSFSLDAVITGLRTAAPDVVEWFQQLAKVTRFEDDDDLSRIVRMRSTTALCTLLKGRKVHAYCSGCKQTSKKFESSLACNYSCRSWQCLTMLAFVLLTQLRGRTSTGVHVLGDNKTRTLVMESKPASKNSSWEARYMYMYNNMQSTMCAH